MPSQVDHVADKNGVELVRLARLYELPPFVKQADTQLTMNPPADNSAYADLRNRQFPCHSAASTWLSHLYYAEKRAEFHPKDRVHIEKQLDHYSTYWRIKAHTDEIATRWEELHKTAEQQLPDTDFAYVWVGGDGTKQRHMRMTSAAEVKAAGDYVLQYRDRFPFAVRHFMAKRILEKAARFGAGLGESREFLEKQAGMGCGDTAEIVGMIRYRASLVPTGVTVKTAADEQPITLQQHFLSLADNIAKKPRQAMQPGMLIKLAETLDTLDRVHNFTSRYGHGLPRPEDIIFSTTFSKVASDLTHLASTTSGSVYEKTAFSKVPVADLQSLLGTEFVQRVTTPLGDIDCEKFAEEISTLPRPDAEMLDALLSESNIRPTLTKAASVRHGLSLAEQQAWANAYVSSR